MKTIINAQILPGRGAGGVETVLVALVRALGRLDGNDEFVVVTRADAPDWIRPFAGPNSKVISAPRGVQRKTRVPAFLRRMFSPLKTAITQQPIEWSFPAVSSGFFESLGGDVIHFPCQDFTICSIPSVYSPHDLQHRHFPQFFDARALVWREETYRKGCDYSRSVVVGSQWVKDDIIGQFGIHSDKIQVIPLAPPMQAFSEPNDVALARVKKTYGIEKTFVLYPSMTWPHKNHIRFIEAMKRSSSGLDAICTGFKNDHWNVIEAHLKGTDMSSRVRFPGLIPAEDLRALYRLCEFVVIPTLFESTKDFSWETTARAFRALYRQVARQTLTPEEVGLLTHDWMAPQEEKAA
ncbi:MAG: glycosyltransferase [Deltaproteobacteria bacterium]|nr:glycosyltransferase [Deltaproteobacteria bacterium]